ncbi:DDE-type integrase/transposase/recombinase, partial [Acinetobacter wanghuae]|uniref:DDE-type integrase/transposase/recombinase n=1 Tax=Acinetobacter wanghuae TaxID=2662362 RepID=UPI003AF68A45
SDITYIWTGKTWAYLAVVLDLYARRVIGWSMSVQADQHLVIKALDEAWHRRGKPSGMIFHSLAKRCFSGSQYKSLLVRYRLACYAMQQSMSRKGNCWDNAPTERLFRSLKT